MQTIARRLLDNNEKLVAALEGAEAKAQYKAIEPLITKKLCGVIGREEGQYISSRDLIWAIINEFNGEEQGEELVY